MTTTEQTGGVDELLAEARARLAGDGGDEDEEEDAMIPDNELPRAGPDETLVLEAPLESLTEKTRRMVVLAQVVAEEHLPAPGPPRDLRVRFRVPYLKSTAEAYESLTERKTAPFLTGKGWAGQFAPSRPNEAWVDIGPYGHDLPRTVLHELCHAWRERTPEARAMSAEAKEEEANSWAEELLPKVFALAWQPAEAEAEAEGEA